MTGLQPVKISDRGRMRNETGGTDQLVWGAIVIGWLFGITTMLLLGYSPDNCFIQN